MVLLRGPFPPKIQTMPTVLSTDARQNLGPLGGAEGLGGGRGGAEGLGGAGRKGGRKGWGGGAEGGRKGWGGGAEGLGGGGGGEEHEYPVFHLFLV